LETVPKTTMSGARTMWAFAQVWFNEYVCLSSCVGVLLTG
jgi:hypothetical protein